MLDLFFFFFILASFLLEEESEGMDTHTQSYKYVLLSNKDDKHLNSILQFPSFHLLFLTTTGAGRPVIIPPVLYRRN